MPPIARRLLRIRFTNPRDDYIFIQDLEDEQGILALNRDGLVQLVVVRQSYSSHPLTMLQMISEMKHPNIADVLDVYFDKERQLLIATEFLDVSLLELQQGAPRLEEWELATIISEVISYAHCSSSLNLLGSQGYIACLFHRILFRTSY